MKLQEATLARNRRGGRIFLAEKGIEVPLEPVDIGNAENRQPPFLAKNPLGGVPVLELADGTCIAESVAICRCFGELHPDPPLMGVDAQDNAVIEMCNRRMELELALPMMNVFRHGDPFFAGRIEQVPDWSEASRRHVAGRMEWLDRELAAREFVAGDRYPIADVTALVGVDFQRVSMISIREEHPQPEAMARGGLEPAEREGLRPRRRWSAAAPGVFPYQPTSWAGDGRSSSGSGGASNRTERSPEVGRPPQGRLRGKPARGKGRSCSSQWQRVPGAGRDDVSALTEGRTANTARAPAPARSRDRSRQAPRLGDRSPT